MFRCVASSISMPKNPLQTRSTIVEICVCVCGVRALPHPMQYVRSHQYMSSLDWRNSFRFCWGTKKIAMENCNVAIDAEVSQSQSQIESNAKKIKISGQNQSSGWCRLARDLQNVTFDLDLITWQNVDKNKEKRKKNNSNAKSAAKINKKKSGEVSSTPP